MKAESSDQLKEQQQQLVNLQREMEQTRKDQFWQIN